MKADLPATQAAAVGEQLRQLFSPVIESAGLIGDYIRFFRQAATIRAMSRVRQIAKEAGIELKPVPPKMLIPWVEAVSLEEADSELVEMWANLLVSASNKHESHHVHFVSIISQLSEGQGTLFAKIVGTKSQRHLALALDTITEKLEAHRVRRTFDERFGKAEENSRELNLEQAEELVASQLNCLGVELEYADVGVDEPTNYTEVSLPYESAYSDAIEVDFSILEAVGLIRRVSVDFEVRSKYSITLKYYHLTHLGSVFAEACGLVRDLGVTAVLFDRKHIFIKLTSGAEYTLPLNQYPQIRDAPTSQRNEFEITYISVRWPRFNLEIDVREILEQKK